MKEGEKLLIVTILSFLMSHDTTSDQVVQILNKEKTGS